MNIRAKRLELGLTQIEVAKACGVSLTTYQLWEREVSTPLEENLKKERSSLGKMGLLLSLLL